MALIQKYSWEFTYSRLVLPPHIMGDIGSNNNIILVQSGLFYENQSVVDEDFASIGLIVVFPGLLDCLYIFLAYDIQDCCSCLGYFDNLLCLISNTTAAATTTTTTPLGGGRLKSYKSLDMLQIGWSGAHLLSRLLLPSSR